MAEYYVYCLINDDWGMPFYVGKGSGNRRISKSGRSKQVLSIMNKFPWRSKVLIDGLSESDALIMEKYIKAGFKEMGAPIIDNEVYGCASAQRAGIDMAKLDGRHLGRPKVELPDNWDEVTANWKAGKITAVEAMRMTGLKRSTFYKFASENG